MRENLAAFLVEVLDLGAVVADSANVESIRRMSHSRFTPNEVLVAFKDAQLRDTIIGRSGMLSEMVNKQENNRPTAGIRVVVPEHMRRVGKLLGEYGRRIRHKHKGTKHHIKFDDAEHCLFLNVKLQGDNFWSRVYEENAETWIKQMRREEASRLNKHLNKVGDEERTRPLSASSSRHLSAANLGAKKKTASWTGKASQEPME